MKNSHTLLVCMFVSATAIIFGSRANDTTTLSPYSMEAVENTNETLTCSYSGQYENDFKTIGSFIWHFSSTGQLNTFEQATISCRDCKIPDTGWLSNRALYSYRCINDTSHSVTLLNIARGRHGETYKCSSAASLKEFNLSNSVTVLVTVPVKVVNVSQYTGVLTKAENATTDLLCTSSPCWPQPKFQWYLTNPNGSTTILREKNSTANKADAIQSYTSRLNIPLERAWNDRFLFCGASKNDVEYVLSEKILLNVTYPSDGPPMIEKFQNGSEIKVIQYRFVYLKCLIAGGNPLPRLEWNKNIDMPQIVSGRTVTRNITWQAVDLEKDELYCTSIQMDLKYTTFVSVNVLYPPEKPAIMVLTSTGTYVHVNETLNIIEGRKFTLNCSAKSNPPVSLFKWNTMTPTNDSNYYSAGVDRRHVENIACKVSNTMQISDSTTSVTGENTTYLKVNVLYPPTMNALTNVTVIEGRDLDYSCDFRMGNPTATNITWSWNDGTLNHQQLKLSNISRNQSGVYRCSVQNVMISSDGLKVFGNDSGEFHLFVQNKTSPVDTNTSTSAPLTNASLVIAGAAAGTAGGLIIIVALIIVVICYKRRLKNKKQDVSCQYIGLKNPKETNMELNHDDQQTDNSNEQAGRQTISNDVHSLQELDDYEDNVKTDCGIYGNDYSMIKRIERIELVELFPYLTDKTAEFFSTDYAKLPQGLTKPYEFSQRPENIALNRYHGIYPYDHSRVKIPGSPEYFINACYIEGYKRKKAYIASLGPLSKTSNRFVMFWQMVWSEKSDVIVMLTKLTEPSGVKCDQYWPKDVSSEAYGEVTVTSTGEENYSDYIMRKFSITKGGQKRNLKHFHFMAWPDKSIPADVTCLLEFRRSVRASHSSGPLIVHCSAGIGRTGTFIAIDMLIEEGQKKGSVNVLECVKTMRDQRVNMVQTLDQYYYVYKTLVNALVFDNEAIPAEKIHKYVETSKLNRFSDMFKTFNLSVESDTTIENTSRNVNKALKEKNRVGSDIPGDTNRVRLFLNRGMEASDYINAVYLNSFRVADHFIAAQSALPSGVEDFICLIYQENCCCVVSMDGEQARQSTGSYVPPDNSNFTASNYNVQCSRLDTKETYIVRKLKIEINGPIKGAAKVVYHFQFLGWSDGNKVPNDPRQFVEFTEDVERFAGQFGTEGSHVLVHCSNAFERSCLFCAVVALIEKIKHEKEVCIPNTLRQIRTRRKLAIPTLEQFKFCYQAADAFVSNEKAGTNNAENSYMNVTMT